MDTLSIAQITVAIIVIALILIQERSSGMSVIFGGCGGDSFYQTRRGLEKIVFSATIIGMALFAILALLNILV